MKTWKDLDVWKKAHELVLRVYRLVDSFPSQEQYRLVDQLCRSASSVPANIVEGQSRQTTKEYLQFLYNARGSTEETKYHLLLARDPGYLDNSEYQNLLEGYDSVGRMLNGLINSLKDKNEGIPKS